MTTAPLRRNGFRLCSGRRPAYPSRVQRIFLLFLLVAWGAGGTAIAAEPAVTKVLPHLLDQAGRHAPSPSLFDRDAYQKWLRAHPDEQSGVRYDVHWRAARTGEFVLRLELLGRVEQGKVNRKTVNAPVTSKHARLQWTEVKFAGEEFKQFGPVVAWRVSLWQGDEMLAKHQSFLWE